MRVLTIISCILAAACDPGGATTDASPSPPDDSGSSADGQPADSGSPAETAMLVGAGDIADCDPGGADLTANLLDDLPGTIFLAGDNAYEDGTLTEYNDCFAPTWGRHKARIRPSPGNHEYHASSSAAGYFAYFGSAAGPAGKGWYSYDLGAWHIVVLNTNDSQCGYRACGAGSEQEQWLRADLAAHPSACTLAYFHHPRFSSGDHGNNPFVTDLWRALDEHGVDVVLNGHDHHYERFAPQDADGNADPAGIRQFIVGTGGRSHYAIGTAEPNSEVRNGSAYGVLALTLAPGSYEWRFVPVAGASFTDSGSGTCH